LFFHPLLLSLSFFSFSSFSFLCFPLCFLSLFFSFVLFFLLFLSLVFSLFYHPLFLVSSPGLSHPLVFIRGKGKESYPTLSNHAEWVGLLGSPLQGLSPLFFNVVVGHGCGLC
jgi:hypothetical protein